MARFVVIEGLIGVGKSSLCRAMAEEWKAQLVLEPAETNPFLALFYEDPKRYALPVQMFYLVNRWRQQEHVRQPGLFEDLVISDYLWLKDRLFAEKTLDPLELDLYDRFASALGDKAPVPDLVVWLTAPIDVLLQRIRRRKAPGEHHIKRDYLEDLQLRYERMFAAWTACPVLVIDNTEVNYVEDPLARRDVLGRIRSALGGGNTPDSPGFLARNREDQPSLFGSGA